MTDPDPKTDMDQLIRDRIAGNTRDLIAQIFKPTTEKEPDQ